MKRNGEVLALASMQCEKCAGAGFLLDVKGLSTGTVCRCVNRRVFEVCYRKFRECVNKPKHLSQVTMTRMSGPRGGRPLYGRVNEEYIGDFWLMAKRILRVHSFEYQFFRFHFLLGADQSLVCRRLKLTRAEFFNAKDRIVCRLGRAFHETEPFGLYPLDEYWGSWERGPVTPCAPAEGQFTPVRPPLDEAA